MSATIIRRPYQAITTYALPPINHQPLRIRARTASELSAVVPWDYGLDVYDNHARAAAELLDRLSWGGEWVGGATSRGYVFVRTDVGQP